MTAVVVVTGVAVTTVVELVHLAATPKASKGVAIKGVFGVPPQAAKQGDHASGVYRPSSTSWPAPASTVLAVSADALPTRTMPVFARPVERATGPSRVSVQVQDHQRALDAGASGVLLTVGADAGHGPVRIGLDYSGFAQAYGGNYGSRLRLVSCRPAH